MLNISFKVSNLRSLVNNCINKSSWVLNCCSILCAIFTLFLLLLNVFKGFDLTDESLYILVSGQPDQVLSSVSHFGYFTSIFFQFSGKNIGIFRLLGIFILLFCTAAFIRSLSGYLKSYGVTFWTKNYNSILWLTSIVSVLTYYGSWWLITPSYNWQILMSILMVGSGLLLAYQKKALIDTHLVIWGGFIVGVFIAINFMAKPTSAAILVFISFLWVIVHGRVKQGFIFFAISLFSFLFLLLTHILYNFKSVGAYYENIHNGLKLMTLLQAMDIKNLFTSSFTEQFLLIKKLNEFFVFKLGFLIIVVSIISYNFKSSNRNSKIYEYIFIGLIFSFWFTLILSLVKCMSVISEFSYYLGFLTPSVLFIAVLFLLIQYAIIQYFQIDEYRLRKLSDYYHLIKIILFLYLLCFAYAFGSSNPLMLQMSGALVFLIIGVLFISMFISEQFGNKFFINLVALFVGITILIILLVGYWYPYRLTQSIFHQNNSISFLGSTGQLSLDQKTYSYVNQMISCASAEGWKKGNGLIDLTGATPGASVILGAKIIAAPWFMGGYPGSEAYAKFNLSHVPSATLKQAWVLTAHKGVMKLSDDVFHFFNSDFPNNYKMVCILREPQRDEEQQLWMPVNN